MRAAGAVLAELHDALAAYPDNDRVAALERPSEPLTARITSWLDSGAEHLPAAARDTLRRLVVGAPPNRLPMQFVHGDFRSANILYAGAEVAATLDFEEAGFDHRVVELARSAVMLGTRFRNWGPVSGEVRAEFLSGYQCARQLTPVEAGWWDALVLWHALALVPPGGDPTGWAPSALSHLAGLTNR